MRLSKRDPRLSLAKAITKYADRHSKRPAMAVLSRSAFTFFEKAMLDTYGPWIDRPPWANFEFMGVPVVKGVQDQDMTLRSTLGTP